MVSRYLDAMDDPDQVLKGMTATHLVPRAAQPEEISRLACFLASDDAAFLNGAAYLADGGSLAWRGTNA
jgi:NAD(P)-dependent dehydrogenase (short-subunit alcohol dehydrogenase family)